MLIGKDKEVGPEGRKVGQKPHIDNYIYVYYSNS